MPLENIHSIVIRDKSRDKCPGRNAHICTYTVMDKSIHTPVKRQYINAHFEMAVYHKKRVATILNFLSFIIIDIKGSHSILAEKSLLALKW